MFREWMTTRSTKNSCWEGKHGVRQREMKEMHPLVEAKHIKEAEGTDRLEGWESIFPACAQPPYINLDESGASHIKNQSHFFRIKLTAKDDN